MALLNDDLSVWEIGFRWSDLDPSGFHLRLPLPVRDNFRLMMGAILHGHLQCDTLMSSKWQEEDGKELRPFFIRHHLGKVEACIAGARFDRSLMRWATVSRGAFLDWCERQAIPLPEFWFPPGWRQDYLWPFSDEETREGEEGEESAKGQGERPAQRHRIACQEIASAIWKDQPNKTIADMVKDASVRKLGGGIYYAEETVRRWVKVVAPPEVSAKRGRPAKKRDDDGDLTTS